LRATHRPEANTPAKLLEEAPGRGGGRWFLPGLRLPFLLEALLGPVQLDLLWFRPVGREMAFWDS